MHRLTAGLVAGSLLVVAACGGDDEAATTDPEPIGGVADDADSVDDTEAVDDDTPPDTTGTTDPDDPSDTTVLPTTAPETDPTTTVDEVPVETDPPEPEPAELPIVGRGEYEVGVQTVTITDAERDRPLEVDVWFPLTEGTAGEPHRYTFITGDYYESPEAVSADAASISADGPFPLVVYSHGSGGLRYIDSDYSEDLASHGYVVVAADHAGNTAIDRFLETEDDRATIAYNRPRDIQVLIDQMTNPESTDTAGFVGSVDPERVAVTGHSLGGYGTLAVGGGMSNEAGTIEPDTRVDALIPLAPAIGDGDPSNSLLVADQLANITVPVLVMVGTDDITTPPNPNVDRTVAEVSSDEVYRLDLVAAEHQSFTDVCDYLEFFPTLENPTPEVVGIIETFAEQGCSAGDMPLDRVQDLRTTFAVTFLDSVFSDGEMIEPDAFVMPDDVIYTVK